MQKLLTFLVLILFIVLLSAAIMANSALVAKGIEALIARSIDGEVAIESARISFFPRVNVNIKNLSISRPESKAPLFRVAEANLQGDLIKLLNRSIHITRLELTGFTLRLPGSQQGGPGLPEWFFKRNENSAAASDNNYWRIALINLILQQGTIISQWISGQQKESLGIFEQVKGQVRIGDKDLSVTLLQGILQTSSWSLSGSVKDYTGKEPKVFMQLQGTSFVALFKEILPEQVYQFFAKKQSRFSFLVEGLLPKLLLNANLQILSNKEAGKEDCTNMSAALHASFEDGKHLKIASMTVSSPLGAMIFEGAIENLFTNKQQIALVWTSRLVPDCLAGTSQKQSTLGGSVSCSGKITGAADNFTLTTDFDLSALIVSIPHLTLLPGHGLQSISLNVSSKEDTITINNLTLLLRQSTITLLGQIKHALHSAYIFDGKAEGTLALSEVIRLFPSLQELKLAAQGSAPFQFSITGSSEQQGALQIHKGLLQAFGTTITVKGDISKIFSEEPMLALQTTCSPNGAEIQQYFPEIFKDTWQLSYLPPFTLSLQGPLQAVHLEGDADLRDLYIRTPGCFIQRPGGDSHLHVEARLQGKEAVQVQHLALHLGGSWLSLRDAVLSNYLDEPSLRLQAQMLFQTAELVGFFPLLLPEELSVQGPVAATVTLKGIPADFTLLADADLTATNWKYLQRIGKAGGLHNRVSLELHKVFSDAQDSTFSIRDLFIDLGDSLINMRGTAAELFSRQPKLNIQVAGIVQTEEFMGLLYEPLPEGFRVEGPATFVAGFQGGATAFNLDADVNLSKTFWEDPYFIAKLKGLRNEITLTIHKDEDLLLPWGQAELTVESATIQVSVEAPGQTGKPWRVAMITPLIALERLQSLKWYQQNGSATGSFAVDMQGFIYPSRLQQSLLEGTVRLEDIALPFPKQGTLINMHLDARQNLLNIPMLTIQQGKSDISLAGEFSWGEVPALECRIISDFLDSSDFTLTTRQDNAEEQLHTAESQAGLLPALRGMLEYRPRITLDAKINNFQMGNQLLQDCSISLHGTEGSYYVINTFTTAKGKSSVEAAILPINLQAYKGNYRFAVYGLNVSELAKLGQFKKIPITGRLDISGSLESISNPGDGWFNPESLNGHLSLSFTDGVLKKFPILRNVLLLMKLPLSLPFVPVLREVFLFEQAVQLVQTKGRVLSITAFPYKQIGGTFTVKQGLATTQDLMLTSDVLTLAASGTVDMSTRTLDGKIAARPFGPLRSLMEKIPKIGGKVKKLQDKLTTTYFTVQGPWDHPEVKAVALETAKETTRRTFGSLSKIIKPRE